MKFVYSQDTQVRFERCSNAIFEEEFCGGVVLHCIILLGVHVILSRPYSYKLYGQNNTGTLPCNAPLRHSLMHMCVKL